MTEILTKQAVFDIAAIHLLKQGECSMLFDIEICEGDNNCAYRGANGLKCAVGVLIPDSLYSPEMEDQGVPSLFADFHDTLEKAGLNHSRHLFLLAQLQRIHDEYDPSDWRTQLVSLGNRCELSTANVEGFGV